MARKPTSFWQFAIVNGRLAEIHYVGVKIKKGMKFKKIYGHAYVDESEFKTKREKRWIKEDTQKTKLSYKKGIYRDRLSGRSIPVGKLR